MAFKICFVVTDAVSFNALYRGQLEYLAEHGYHLTLICGGVHVELERLRARNVGQVIDLELVREPRPWVDALSLLRLLWHFASNRYDLVVTTTPKALLLGSIAAFIMRQPRRVAFFQGRVYENFRGVRRKVYRLFDRLTIACMHEVLFVSRSLMTEVVNELPAAEKKGRVLGNGSGNGVCMQKFSPEAVSPDQLSSLRCELGIGDSELVVLVVGRICRDKGLAEISDVAERVAASKLGIRFVFVGPTEGAEADEQLKRLIATGSAIHVNFTQDVVPYFALADIHLFLSHREGFGNVAIEAAAMGIPTIAFDVVGIRDSVAEGISGHRFPFGDTASVASAILNLCGDRESISQRFDDARQWAAASFSQKYVWSNYADFYAGLQASS